MKVKIILQFSCTYHITTNEMHYLLMLVISKTANFVKHSFTIKLKRKSFKAW